MSEHADIPADGATPDPDATSDAVSGTPDQKTGRQPRPRRARGAAESLGSIVLAFESIIVFLAGLVVYGLKATPPGIEPWWGIVGGAVVAVLMLVVSGLLRYRWAIVVGWLLQVVVALAAFWVPAILVIAVIFGGMWAYATIKGASLDRRNARLAREAEASTPEEPESSNGV
ncbi:DUF4233 domain-containing protein [Microbacterium candidum]|uniref:DUF4233 domain-containing protein n=1 Tax=Microbacterium candidum TaxID=3041922 RepID=A0ABT7MYS2_9MICO|nr:DUF4233 domain-containing protein [Microbacterium sp. ASV49]MDL9979599.1 DUF4233 domain-containing protein [Microbacterium sp. ASV49]